MLELVDRTILSFVDVNHERSSRSSDKEYKTDKWNTFRGYSLNGKTTILRIVKLGSIPGISTVYIIGFLSLIAHIYKLTHVYIADLNASSRSSIGWAEHWRCLGYKFKSYLEHSF